MNQEKQRIAIAKACGWEQSPDGKKWRTPYRSSYRFRRKIGDQFYYANDIHDYLNSLDAMHEAVQVLAGEQRQEFIRQLIALFKEPLSLMNFNFAFVNATAAQRAESFLRTLGLWTEEE